MKIEEFCHFLKRYSTKFEHQVVCIKKQDIDKEKTKAEWKEEYIDYLRRTEIEED